MNLYSQRLFLSWLFYTLILSISSSALGLDVPPLQGRVNDLAGMLPSDSERQLEGQLRQFEQETGHQIVVLTIPSLEGDPIEDFGIKVGDAWKIGQKGTANGVILLVAQKERKIRIEVGRGLEGIMPDAVASRIIREVIAPRYRDEDYAGAIAAGIDSILEITRGEAATKPLPNQERKRGDRPVATFFVFVAFFAGIFGILQRSPLRAGLTGTTIGAIIGSVGSIRSGAGVWIAITFTGAVVGALVNFYSAKVWGRPWTVRRSRRDSWPRDTLYYGGTGDGGSGGGGGLAAADLAAADLAVTLAAAGSAAGAEISAAAARLVMAKSAASAVSKTSRYEGESYDRES